MGVVIVEAGMTDELVVKAFTRLCDAEVKKKVGFNADTQEGLQNGFIFCLNDVFGQVDEQTNVKNYEAGKSYLHIIEQIMSEQSLIRLVCDLLEKGQIEIEDILTIHRIVKCTVREFFVDRHQDMRAAIKFL